MTDLNGKKKTAKEKHAAKTEVPAHVAAKSKSKSSATKTTASNASAVQATAPKAAAPKRKAVAPKANAPAVVQQPVAAVAAVEAVAATAAVETVGPPVHRERDEVISPDIAEAI